MIIGIDHIALSAGDIDRAIEVISGWGYKVKFTNKKLLNHPAKAPFLSTINKYHDVSFCQPLLPGPAIELTSHGSQFIETTPLKERGFKVLFSHTNPGIGVQDDKPHLENCKTLSEVYKGDVIPSCLPEFNTECYYLKDGNKDKTKCASVKCVLIESIDIEKSCKFWKSFNFIERRQSLPGGEYKWKLLEFKSHLPGWCLDIVIKETNKKNKIGEYKIDMAGFPCIALLTMDIYGVTNSFHPRMGIKIGDIFPFKVGGQALEICMLSDPDSGYVELIKIVKEKNGI